MYSSFDGKEWVRTVSDNVRMHIKQFLIIEVTTLWFSSSELLYLIDSDLYNYAYVLYVPMYVHTDICTYRHMHIQWSDGGCLCEYVFMCYATCDEFVYPLVLLGQRVLRTMLWWTRTKETRHCCPTMRRKSEDWESMCVCVCTCVHACGRVHVDVCNVYVCMYVCMYV